MALYKIYFYDIGLKSTYPITIAQKNICELAKWLNGYIAMWNMEVINGVIVDSYHNEIGLVEFIPTEIESQRFLTNYPERLLEYYRYNFSYRRK